MILRETLTSDKLLKSRKNQFVFIFELKNRSNFTRHHFQNIFFLKSHKCLAISLSTTIRIKAVKTSRDRRESYKIVRFSEQKRRQYFEKSFMGSTKKNDRQLSFVTRKLHMGKYAKNKHFWVRTFIYLKSLHLTFMNFRTFRPKKSQDLAINPYLTSPNFRELWNISNNSFYENWRRLRRSERFYKNDI